MDVDHFKAYNDHLGHQAGDACLVDITGALAALHARAGSSWRGTAAKSSRW